MRTWGRLAAMLLLCGLAPVSWAQEGECAPEAEDEEGLSYGTLKVQLIDPFNSVVVNDATVTVPGGTVIHDEFSGLFIVNCLLLGQVPILVSAPGFEEFSTVVALVDEVQFETVFLQPICGPGVAGFSRVDVQLIDPELADVVSEAEVFINGESAVFDIFRGMFFVECAPWGAALVEVTAPGYQAYSTAINLDSLTHFEPVLMTALFVEGEEEGDPEGCKGCSVLTSVFVSVYNQNTNAPILGASVTLQGSGAQAAPSNFGVYTFPLLTDGSYTILVAKAGFANRSVQISVASEVSRSVAAPMTPNVVDLFTHAADADGSGSFSLSELLTVVQLYNAQQYHCVPSGYVIGNGPRACPPHSCDFVPEGGDFRLTLSELLRGIQIYTFTAYYACESPTEDGFCLGVAP